MLIVDNIPQSVAQIIQPDGKHIRVVISDDAAMALIMGGALEIRIRGSSTRIEILARTVD